MAPSRKVAPTIATKTSGEVSSIALRWHQAKNALPEAPADAISKARPKEANQSLFMPCGPELWSGYVQSKTTPRALVRSAASMLYASCACWGL